MLADETTSTARKNDRPRGLRVLLVVEAAAAGTGRHVVDLAEGLVARGCDVHLIHSDVRLDQNFRDRLASMPTVKRTVIPMRRAIHPSDFGVVRAVRRYLREHGPFDLIHGHSSKGGAIARLAAIGTGTPALYTIHGLTVADPSLPWRARFTYLSIERLLSRFTARVVAVSPEEQRVAVKLGMGGSRVIFVANGIGEQKMTPRDQARTALCVRDENVVVGFVGRLVGQKAPDILIRAFAKAASDAPHARLAMIGGGPLLESLRELTVSLGIGDKVLWLGERDARQLYRAFDLFAMSSKKEGLPYVVLEAMAAGLPIVATDTCGVEILVDHESNGLVLPLGDTEGFANALRRVVLDPALRAQFGENALRKSKLFTIDEMVAKTLTAYHDVVRERASAKSQTDVAPDYDDALLASDGEMS